MSQLKAFMEILFDSDDLVGLKKDKSDGSASALNQSLVSSQATTHELVHIHPFHPIDEHIEKMNYRGDYELTHVYFNTCSAQTITKFRSFLVELDPSTAFLESCTEEQKLDLIELQREFFEAIEMPFSMAVFSGNKSVHFAIVLDEPLTSIEEWKDIRSWIETVVESKISSAAWLGLADNCAVDVPSYNVGIRIPGVLRKDTGKVQHVVALNDRVSKIELFDWLNQEIPFHKRNIERKTPYLFELNSGQQKTAFLTRKLLNVIKKGLGTSYQTKTVSRLCGSLAYQNFSRSEIEDVLDFYVEGVEDLDSKELINIIEDAIKWSEENKNKSEK